MKKQCFGCDSCGKEITIDDGEGFQYKGGWVYLYDFNFKKEGARIIQREDKHFCCKDHLLYYIKSLVEEPNETKLGNNNFK